MGSMMFVLPECSYNCPLFIHEPAQALHCHLVLNGLWSVVKRVVLVNHFELRFHFQYMALCSCAHVEVSVLLSVHGENNQVRGTISLLRLIS